MSVSSLSTVPPPGGSSEGYSSEGEEHSSSHEETRAGLSRRTDPGSQGESQAGGAQWPERPPERETGATQGARHCNLPMCTSGFYRVSSAGLAAVARLLVAPLWRHVL